MAHMYIDRIDHDLTAQMDAALQFIGWQNIVRPGARVFIKPNLTWPDPKPGVTTSPAFLDALLTVLTSRTSHIYVGEFDGSTFAADFFTHSKVFAQPMQPAYHRHKPCASSKSSSSSHLPKAARYR